MQIELLTPDKKVFSGEASGVKLPGLTGSFEVLENHAPIVSALQAGTVRVALKNNSTKTLEIKGGGFVEVLNNQVMILAEGIEEA